MPTEYEIPFRKVYDGSGRSTQGLTAKLETSRKGLSRLNSQTQTDVTPKLDHKYFDKEMCYAPPKKTGKSRIELCKTLLPVPESPMSPPDHERGPSLDTPLMQPVFGGFHASYHVQKKAIRERQ